MLSKARVLEFGGWRGVAWLPEGQFMYRETLDGWRVWRWDGKRFRSVKKWPEELLAGYKSVDNTD
jgi:hypothetical protein